MALYERSLYSAVELFRLMVIALLIVVYNYLP